MVNVLKVKPEHSNSRMYGGLDYKFGATIDGIDYIVKIPRDNSMTAYSEYIASKFIRGLGIHCHEAKIAVYGGGITAVAVKDFTSHTNSRLYTFRDIKDDIEYATSARVEYTYDDILNMLNNHIKMTASDRNKAKQQFWDMFICDAIVGNSDRHSSNWGFMKAEGDEWYRPAPIYDNGSSLYPGICREIDRYKNVNTRKDILYEQVLSKPVPLFEVGKSRKLYKRSYESMLRRPGKYKGLRERVKMFRSNLSAEKVFGMMVKICDGLPLDASYKRFYVELVTLRYMCLMLGKDFSSSYEKVEMALSSRKM